MGSWGKRVHSSIDPHTYYSVMNQMDCVQFLRPNFGHFHPDHTAEAGSGSQGIAADAGLFPPGVIVSGSEITHFKRYQSYLCKCLPFTLIILRQRSPLFSNNLGDLGIGQARIMSDHHGLIMLTIQNKS